jgi:uncharacterized protein YdbL (DUF1318 family)
MKAACLALLLAGCVAVTINVSFPQEKLDSAASSIEDMVESTPKAAPAKPGAPPTAPKPESLAPTAEPRWVAWLLPDPAEAQVPELKTRTPEVMAAIESRRKRVPGLEAAAARLCLGENNQGLVEARPDGKSCPANLGELVAAENGDRMFLYKTLVQQNNMPPGDLTRVQAAFAKVRREKAAPGTLIQLENGQWTKK